MYKNYCEEDGEQHDSANRFAMQMEEKGFEKKKRKNGNFWLGIQLMEAHGFEVDSPSVDNVIILKKG